MGVKKKQEFYFFALAPTGSGISGSDRIFIELARQWSREILVTIFTTEEGVSMVKIQRLINSKSKILNQKQFQNLEIQNKKEKGLRVVRVEEKGLPKNFFLKYFYKIFLGIKLGFSLTINHQSSIINHQPLTINHQTPTIFLYSSSDFWMDSFPAVILKIRNPKFVWVSTCYQTAPNPFKGYSEGEREKKYFLRALLYWLSQLPVKLLIKKFADFVIVNNEDERKRFPELDKKGKVIVLIGAVRLDEIRKFQKSYQPSTINHQSLIFDAVFQGRFHPQKGVLELIDIWKRVVDKKPDAKLALIGNGPLMQEVKDKIKKLELEKNVKLFGYLFDGPKKYKIFAQSKIVVHPAFYDSGGMAAAEAMAFGVPCVGFNLKAFESYYPKGMLKVKIGDLDAFADAVIKLLTDKNLRYKIAKEALEMIEKNWSWKKRAEEVFSKIINH